VIDHRREARRIGRIGSTRNELSPSAPPLTRSARTHLTDARPHRAKARRHEPYATVRSLDGAADDAMAATGPKGCPFH
jgi:hypothetical protein